MLLLVHWDVSPEIFRLGPLALRWYGLLFALGFLLGFLVMRWIFEREGRSLQDADTGFLYTVAGTAVAGRLAHCLFYEPAYYLEHPLEVLAVWKGGLASHGTTAGILVALYFFTRNRPRLPYLWLLDRVGIGVALGAVFVRLGNLFNSEILGTPTDLPWAFVFARVDDVPRHPVQLYEAVFYAVLFVVLLGVYRWSGRLRSPGALIGVFLISLFGFRFLVEFVKLPQAAFARQLPLTMGQWLSIPFVLLGIYWLARAVAGGSGSRTPI